MPQPKEKSRKSGVARDSGVRRENEAPSAVLWSDVKHFVPKDFTCTCEGLCDHPVVMSLEVVAKLDRLSDLMGRPFKILSGTRCERHNARIRGKRLSSHVPTNGISYAVDVYCPDAGFRFAFLAAALLEFRRIGIGKDHIHVDDHPELPGRVAWLSGS